MKVLVACEYSGRVRDAFIKRGHDAISCDLLPTEAPGPHYQGDVFDLDLSEFDLMIAHPPCTYLTCSAEWAYKDLPIMINGKVKKLDPNKLYGAKRRAAREEAAEFFMRLVYAPIRRKAIENPVGVMSSRYKNLRKLYIHTSSEKMQVSGRVYGWKDYLHCNLQKGLMDVWWSGPEGVVRWLNDGAIRQTVARVMSHLVTIDGRHGATRTKDGRMRWLNNGDKVVDASEVKVYSYLIV